MGDLNEKQLEVEYRKRYDSYYLLGRVVQENIVEALQQHEVEYDFVQMRVKAFPSFFEKAFRYHLSDPLTEIEDLCGVRIIHLFDNDLEKIKRAIRARFQEIKHVDKTLQNRDPARQKEREFSYRSYHIYATLRDKDLKETPQLEGLIAEIQIRTICMHAWASIEHKLNYKKQQDLPTDFRPLITRKFSQMSAMLEVADDLFVSLRTEKNRIIEKYRTDLSEPTKKEKILDHELNIDVLQAYLEENFSEYKQEYGRFKYLLEEMRTSGITLRDIENGQRTLKNKGVLSMIKTHYPTDSGMPTQTGVVRLILDITNDDFNSVRKQKLANSKWMKFVDDLRTRLKD